MSKGMRVLAAVAAAGAIGLGGCGGDDEEPATTEGATGATGASDAAAIPLNDWLTQADDICAEEGQAIDEEATTAFPTGEPTDEELDQFSEEILVPGLQAQYDAISELPAPEENEAEVQELLDSLSAGIEEVESDPAAALTPDSAAFADANRLAREIGLQECGEG